MQSLKRYTAWLSRTCSLSLCLSLSLSLTHTHACRHARTHTRYTSVLVSIGECVVSLPPQAMHAHLISFHQADPNRTDQADSAHASTRGLYIHNIRTNILYIHNIYIYIYIYIGRFCSRQYKYKGAGPRHNPHGGKTYMPPIICTHAAPSVTMAHFQYGSYTIRVRLARSRSALESERFLCVPRKTACSCGAPASAASRW
jgi:hypothetical protein